MNQKMKSALASIAIVVLVPFLLLSACTQNLPVPDDYPKNISDSSLRVGTYVSTDDELVAATQEMKKFASVEDLANFLQKTQQASSRGTYGGFEMMVEGAMPMMSTADAAVGGAKTISTAPAADYSTTNIQVEGVDEADFIKNDGRYIYMLKGRQLIIIDAFPAESSGIVSTTKIEGNSQQLFLNDDKLAVFSTKQEKEITFRKNQFIPSPRYVQRTFVFIFDLSDKASPKLIQEYSASGTYFQSRMIGNHVYFITQDNAYYEPPVIYTPDVRVGVSTIIEPEIFYFDNPEESYVYNTIASFDISKTDAKCSGNAAGAECSGDSVNAKTFLLGYGNTLFVSQNNIYIAFQQQRFWRWGCWSCDDDSGKKFKDIVVPGLPSPFKEDIQAILSGSDEENQWPEIAVVLDSMWKKAEDNAVFESLLDERIKAIQEKIQEFDVRKASERDKTTIHKFSIDSGAIEYAGKGEVAGSLLNQFSMDEFEENLRVATTTDLWAGKRIQHNNVFVLNKDMQKVGELREIAPDERIFSTRFIGDRLYMVTFRQTDPFFVIDLKNPYSPAILGELKLPGFSNYLHPYDADYIIGVGKEADDKGRTQGVKVALFNVSDVKNPSLVNSVEVGGRGSDSEALHDHKAFLFDKEKKLLVIPVFEREEDDYYTESKVWRGAYVFSIDSGGITKKGRIEHADTYEKYWSWNASTSVLRSLYMDDVLYTVSKKFIKMNSLDDLDSINSIALPDKNNDDDDYYYPDGPIPMPMIE